jgi:hypothetical protein
MTMLRAGRTGAPAGRRERPDAGRVPTEHPTVHRRPPPQASLTAADRAGREAALLWVQRMAGNEAAGAWLAEAPVAQRCGDHVEAGCSCADEPHAQRQPAGAAATAPDPAALELPAGSPYLGLPDPVLATLKRSFRDRLQGLPDTGRNLDNAFWSGTPRDLEQALQRLGTAGIELIVEIFHHSGAALWGHVLYMENVWSGTSRGFDFVPVDLRRLEGDLISPDNLCRDTPAGESEHIPRRCYRETVAGSHGTHWCVHEASSCNVHIDMHQTVKGKDPDGTCSYRWGLPLLAHWNDVFGFGPDESPFERVDRTRGYIDGLRREITALPDTDERRPGLMSDLAAASGRLDGIGRQARELAVRGELGEAEARDTIWPAVTDVIYDVARMNETLHPTPPAMPRAG